MKFAESAVDACYAPRWLVVLGALGLAILSGCQTAPHQKGEAASQRLRNASFELRQERRALSSTIEALDTLLTRPADDLRPQYAHVSATLDRLIAAANGVHRTGVSARKANAAYLKAWDVELSVMSYDAVRDQSQARRDEVGAAITSLEERYQEAESAVDPVIAYLRDIRKALASDLTTGGINAIKRIGANARDNAARVQTVLDKLQAQLDDLAPKLSSASRAGRT